MSTGVEANKDSYDGLYDVHMSASRSKSHHEDEIIAIPSPRKSFKENSISNMPQSSSNQNQISPLTSPEGRDFAKSSPREIVQAAVRDFCEDTFAMAENKIHKQRKSNSSIPSQSSSPRLIPAAVEFPPPVEEADPPAAVALSPRETISKAVSTFCAETIASAELEAVKTLSPRPPEIPRSPRAEPTKPAAAAEKKGSPKKSPRAEVENSEGKKKPKGKGEKRHAENSVSPNKQQPSAQPLKPQQQQPSLSDGGGNGDLFSDSVLKGEKMSRIPPPKKVKKKITEPSPTTGAGAEGEVPQTTASSSSSSHTTKGAKESNKRSAKEQKRSVDKKTKGSGLSPSPSGDGSSFPPIRRPSPPSAADRNANHGDNPRNRKLSKISSSKEGKDSQTAGVETESGRGQGDHLPQVFAQKLPPAAAEMRRDRDKEQGKAKKKKQQSKSVPNNRVGGSSEDQEASSQLLLHREQSKSAQMASDSDNHTTLPPIQGALRRSETTPRHKKRKKPLFLRLEDKAKKIQLEIEREKLEMYHQIKLKKIKSQPTREEIEAHMVQYQQLKHQQQEHERELAEARKRDWKAHEPKFISKFISPKKLDFVEEQRAKEREEEEAKKMRLEKAKEFNSAIKVGGGPTPEKPHHSPSHGRGGGMEVVGIGSPRLAEAEAEEGFSQQQGQQLDLKILVPPDSSRLHQSTPPKSTRQQKPPHSHPHSKHSTPGRDNSSPKHQQSKASPNPKEQRRPNPKRLISQSSSVIENLGSPYDGKTGPDWVAEVMEMDAEETVLADVYETGFSMLMVEKGLLSRDPDDEREVSPL